MTNHPNRKLPTKDTVIEWHVNSSWGPGVAKLIFDTEDPGMFARLSANLVYIPAGGVRCADYTFALDWNDHLSVRGWGPDPVSLLQQCADEMVSRLLTYDRDAEANVLDEKCMMRYLRPIRR